MKVKKIKKSVNRMDREDRKYGTKIREEKK
jgi:hypothetical protein